MERIEKKLKSTKLKKEIIVKKTYRHKYLLVLQDITYFVFYVFFKVAFLLSCAWLIY